MRTALLFTMVLAFTSALAPAQDLSQPLGFLNSNLEGLHFYGVSSFFGYSNYNFPQTTLQNSTGANYRATYGVTGSGGWQRFHGQTTFSLHYAGSYNGDVYQSNLNRFNQTVALALARALGPKWKLNISATGQDLSIEQYLYAPSNLGTISQTPATMDDLAASFSVGQFSTSQSGLLLSTIPSGVSPERAVLLGSRILSYNVETSVSYEPSSRLSIRIGGFAMGGQHRTTDQIPGVSDNYILPRTLGGQGSVSFSYSLSPRTQMDFSVAETYLNSSYQKSYGTSPQAGVGRKMGRRWFLRGYVGGLVTENLHQAVGEARTRQVIGGGSIGFRTNSYTILGSFNRSGYDLNGAAVGSNTNISAAWNWHPLRSNWGINSTFTRNETTDTGFSRLWGWRATAGVSRSLGRNVYMDVTYSYLDSFGTYLNLPSQVKVQGVRVTLGWTPGGWRRTQGVVDPEERLGSEIERN